MGTATQKITHQVCLNGEDLIGGDSATARVIFRNISGQNFEHPRPAGFNTHAQYLAGLAEMLKCEFSVGDLITLHAVGDNEPLLVHEFTHQQAEQLQAEKTRQNRAALEQATKLRA